MLDTTKKECKVSYDRENALKVFGCLGEKLINVCPKHQLNKAAHSLGGKGTMKPLVESAVARYVVKYTKGMIDEQDIMVALENLA